MDTAGVIVDVRSLIRRQGVAALVVDDLQEDDLQHLSWAGPPLHVESMRKALARVASREVEYLVVRAPDGAPIAKGGIEHADPRGPGKLWQLATHPELQSHGIGTRLIRELEARVRGRGFDVAWLGVETDNLRARALYERLGYLAFDEEMDAGRPRTRTAVGSGKKRSRPSCDAASR